MLALEDATVAFGRTALLENTRIDLAPGEVKGIIAPNGCGKTTLMRVMAGDLRPLRRGCVRLEGRMLYKDFCSKLVFYMPGDASLLYSHLSVREHLRIARDLWGSDVSMERVAEACGLVGFLGKRVGKLSQGMKQQVSLAVASLSGARYLLLDEPMNALDPLNVQRFSMVIRSMADKGTGVLVSSHILDNIDQLCSSVVLFRDRQLEEAALSESAATLFERYYGSFDKSPEPPARLPRHLRA